MNQKKASMEYGYTQLREDFPELTEKSVADIALPPLFNALWGRTYEYLIGSMCWIRSITITHIRDVSDPHFHTRMYQMVVHGRIIDVTVDYAPIDGKNYCMMACKLTFSSELCDVSIMRDLMIWFRGYVRERSLEALKIEALESIKQALHDNTRLRLGLIYSCIRNFYGDYKLEKFEEELCKTRQENART